MAMNAGTAAVAGRRRHRRRPVMSEINVTPMVDVMLVLLIIFMVSAPLMVNLIPVNLPEGRSGSPASTTERQLAVTLKRTDGACTSRTELYFNESDVAISLAELEAKLKDAKSGGTAEAGKNIRVRAERDTCHSDYSRVLDRIRSAGFGADVAILPEKDAR
jgi:biopolymer transport protein ExbD/biopolymer transport protein TolR